jgi:hypothetical protein
MEWYSERLEKACLFLGLDVGDVGERAAIREYDGGFGRHDAERIAIADILQSQGRLTEDIKRLLLYRRCLDAMAEKGKVMA